MNGNENRMYRKLLTVAGIAAFTCSMAVAQTGMNSPQPKPNSANANSPMNQNNAAMAQPMSSTPSGATGAMQDKKFAKAALAGGMAEVQLGQLAEQKSNSEDVKQFGQRMVDDHTKLNDQMKPIAAQLGVEPPTQLMPKDQELMTRLQGLSGDEFDKAYIKAMLKDHKKDNKEFQMEASNGQNPQEKEAAMQGDQIIKQHLQLAEQLAKAHNIAGGGKASM